MWFIVAAMTAFIGIIAAVKVANRPKPLSDQQMWLRCSNNLRMIALGGMLYARDHSGMFPASVKEIFLLGELDSQVFVCPATKDTPAQGLSAEQVADQLIAGGHLSYRYCGDGVSGPSTDVVVAIEPLSNHPMSVVLIAFADAKVISILPDEAKTIFKQIDEGVRPVRWRRDKDGVTK